VLEFQADVSTSSLEKVVTSLAGTSDEFVPGTWAVLEELSEGTIGDELLPVDVFETSGCITGVDVRFENAPVT
jgi:hypothetical protein